MKSYFKRIKDILTYYDYEPLILFVALFDIIQLSSTLFWPDEWNCNTFQTFDVYRLYDWMPVLYWTSAILIILLINNSKWLVRLITFHTLQSVFYLVHLGGTQIMYVDQIEWFQEYWYTFDILRQVFWMFAWIWILFQIKKKELYQKLGL